MKDLVDRFPKARELVYNPLSGTIATAKACMELPRHRSYVDCNVHAKCFAASVEALAEMYAKQVLIETSESFGSHMVVDACKIVFTAQDGLRARERMRSWRVPDEVCPVLMFQSLVTHFFSSVFVSPSLFGNVGQISLNQWSFCWRQAFIR